MKRVIYTSGQSEESNGQWAAKKKFASGKIVKCLLLFFLSAPILPAYSQWTALTTGVTNTLRAPWFISPEIGVIVGEAIAPDSAIILKTTDGGTTWASKSSGTVNALRGLQFIDANTAYAVGFTGTILKTVDQGETWTPVTSGTTQALRSISFPSHDIGYIAGSAGTMLKTINAGVTWTAQTTGLTQDLINVRFLNNDIGYAVSSTSTFTSGIIIKTTNGGTTWTPVYTNNDGLLGVAVADENTIYAGGGNNQGVGGFSYIVRSTDGGTTWTQVYTGVSNGALRGAWANSNGQAWFVGDLGELPYSNDMGATWTNTSNQANGLLGIQFPTLTIGYAVGAAGTVLKYSPSCPVPSGLVVTNITATAATLGWDAVPGAIGYKISYHAVNTTTGIKKPSSTNAKVIKDLQPSTTYKWAVQSICSNGPVVSSVYVPGPNFTTAPLRLNEEENLSGEMEIYPNPVTTGAEISISLKNSEGSEAMVLVMDAVGRVTMSHKTEITDGQLLYKINIPDSFTPGMYFVKVIVGEETYIGHLLYQK